MLQAYQFGIGIVGIIAVGMIVYGGILIAWNTESIDKRGKGREMITSALTGIAVLFGSYLILNTINPELVKFNLAANLPTSTSPGFVASTTEALSSLQTLCGENGDPAKITRPAGEAPSNPTCEYRKMIYNGPSFEVGADGNYYGEVFNDPIGQNFMIWSYPYFISGTGAGTGTSTAKCLIYAYKNLSNKKSLITKIDLDDNLAMCSLNPDIKQKTSDIVETVKDSVARSRLISAGVQINKATCADVQTSTNCTSLEGMPDSVISLLEQLGGVCKENNSCSPVLTGGTEVAPHPQRSHGPTKAAFDLRSTGAKDDLIGVWLGNNTSVKKICTSEAQKQFRKNCTTVEGNDHFHVEL
jgi:hypothetical protein